MSESIENLYGDLKLRALIYTSLFDSYIDLSETLKPLIEYNKCVRCGIGQFSNYRELRMDRLVFSINISFNSDF